MELAPSPSGMQPGIGVRSGDDLELTISQDSVVSMFNTTDDELELKIDLMTRSRAEAVAVEN